jgi:hypothetical protein
MAFSKRISTQSMCQSGSFVSEEHIKEYCKQGTMHFGLWLQKVMKFFASVLLRLGSILIIASAILGLLLVSSIKIGFTMLIELVNGLKNKGVKKWKSLQDLATFLCLRKRIQSYTRSSRKRIMIDIKKLNIKEK